MSPHGVLISPSSLTLSTTISPPNLRSSYIASVGQHELVRKGGVTVSYMILTLPTFLTCSCSWAESWLLVVRALRASILPWMLSLGACTATTCRAVGSGLVRTSRKMLIWPPFDLWP